MRALERVWMLNVIDQLWIQHLTAIDDLREGIGLRAYGQRDPLIEYKVEAARCSTTCWRRFAHEVVIHHLPPAGDAAGAARAADSRRPTRATTHHPRRGGAAARRQPAARRARRKGRPQRPLPVRARARSSRR